MSLVYIAQDTDHQKIEWLHGGIMSILLDSEKTNGQLMMVRTRGAGGSASPIHVHEHEDEVFFVLEGSGLELCGGRLPSTPGCACGSSCSDIRATTCLKCLLNIGGFSSF